MSDTCPFEELDKKEKKIDLQTKFFVTKLARLDLFGFLFKKCHGYLLKVK